MRHSAAAQVLDETGKPIVHTPEHVTRLFDEELARIVQDLGSLKDPGTPDTFREARTISEAMILQGAFDPL